MRIIKIFINLIYLYFCLKPINILRIPNKNLTNIFKKSYYWQVFRSLSQLLHIFSPSINNKTFTLNYPIKHRLIFFMICRISTKYICKTICIYYNSHILQF